MMASTFQLIVCLALATSVALASPNSHWAAYKNQHGKRYDNPVEDAMRRQIFELNKAEVERFNAHEAAHAGYTKGLNRMSDWTEQERRRSLGLRSKRASPKPTRSSEDQKFLDKFLGGDEPAPKSVDWRKVPHVVTSVKDMGFCTTGYAFAVAGLLEGQERNYSKNHVEGVSLSAQNIIDCSQKNQGCSGGNIKQALEDVISIGGINDDASYQYNGQKGSCHFNKTNSIIDAYRAVQLDFGDEEALKKVVANYGPVAVGLSVTENWFNYKGGLLDDPLCDNLKINHAALVVGYDTDADSGKEYWIIKNSYSAKWGNGGFVYLARSGPNPCNVASYAIIARF